MRASKLYAESIGYKCTIKYLLVVPADKDHITKTSVVIYRYKCDRVECNEEYIGKS